MQKRKKCQDSTINPFTISSKQSDTDALIRSSHYNSRFHHNSTKIQPRSTAWSKNWMHERIIEAPRRAICHRWQDERERERERETPSRLRRFYRTIRDKSRAANPPPCPLIHPCQSRGIKLHYRIIMEEMDGFSSFITALRLQWHGLG